MKFSVFIPLLLVLCFWHVGAFAFWGSNSTETTSGLNVAEGFDVNTITTVNARVLTLPERKGQEQHTLMTVAAQQGTVTVVLGSWWFWEKQAFPLTLNQGIAVTGSLAQGKDGVLYLFAQRIENPATGETVALRTETGQPLWSHNGTGQRTSGSGSRSGRGLRSGMRGGRR